MRRCQRLTLETQVLDAIPNGPANVEFVFYTLGNIKIVSRDLFIDNRGFGLERIEGVDWEPFSRMNDIRLIEGRAPQANDEVVIDETKARTGKLTTSSVLNLIGDKPYRIVGIYSPESTLTFTMM